MPPASSMRVAFPKARIQKNGRFNDDIFIIDTIGYNMNMDALKYAGGDVGTLVDKNVGCRHCIIDEIFYECMGHESEQLLVCSLEAFIIAISRNGNECCGGTKRVPCWSLAQRSSTGKNEDWKDHRPIFEYNLD